MNIQLPQKFALLQNYPNPFNPSTTIEYSITQKQQVELTVYDVLGRDGEVAELVNNVQSPGIYRVLFEDGTLPNGLYFYQLKAKTGTLIRKSFW